MKTIQQLVENIKGLAHTYHRVVAKCKGLMIILSDVM